MEIENDKEVIQVELKAKYLALKAQYEKAMKEENWELVEQIEDDYIDAEEQFVEIALEQLKDKIGENEYKTIKEHWADPQYNEKVVGLLLKLV